MITSVTGPTGSTVRWLDVVAPTKEELQKIAADYGFHPKMVEDCLDPEHLPKFEPIGDKGFLITRAHDPQANRGADTVQALTRKIAIFFGGDFVITIHRVPLPFL